MYTVISVPQTAAAHSRRGWNQKVENLEASRELTRRANQKSLSPEAMASPKPVFQPLNGRKSQYKSQPEITPMHEELIQYLGDSWSQVSKQLESSQEEASKGVAGPPKVVRWKADQDSTVLKDFVPFDLEGWWGTRLYQNLTQAV